MTKRKNQPRATSARTSLKKKPALPLARAERKPLDQKKKPAPRHQRENQLKEKTSPASGPRGAQSHLTERENCPAHRRAIHLTFTGFNKRPKQPLLCRVRVAEPLRVPLDAEAEVRVRLFQCFHNAVLAEGGYF